MNKFESEVLMLNQIVNQIFEFETRLTFDTTKQRIETVRNLEIIIYPNDHNPPHFHVKSKDNSIDAKFDIHNGNYLSGNIGGKELKWIAKFYNNPKTISILHSIWNKYHSDK